MQTNPKQPDATVAAPGDAKERIPRRPRPWRCALLGLMILTSCSGCATTTPAQARASADHQWRTVRARVKLQLARQHLHYGRLIEALEAAAESLGLDSTQPEAYVILARANLELGRFAPAEQAIESARRAGLEHAQLHYVRGVILELLDRPDEALLEFRRAQELEGATPEYLMAEIDCLVTLGRTDEATRRLAERSAQAPLEPSLVLTAARLALMRGETDEAIDALYRVSVAAPEDVQTKETLGLLLARKDRCSEAAPILETILRASPLEDTGHGAIRRALGICYLERRDAPAAQSVLEDYALQSRDDPAALALLAKAALLNDDTFTATRALDHLRQQGEGDARIQAIANQIDLGLKSD